MSAAIETRGLTKFYGKHRGIEEVDLHVETGQVFGFLGPNGAGKTTTIRLAMDQIRPTAGAISVLGMDAHRRCVEVHRQVGFVPGELVLHDGLTGRELLDYFGSLRGGVDQAYVDTLAERLDCDLSRSIRTLSTGNKHKVGIINALMHRPALLVMDEPTAGLDPLVQQEFYRLLAEVRDDGRTVFLSSHNLSELEHVCDRVGIIREGRVVAVESVDALKSKALRHLEVHFADTVPASAFTGLTGVREVTVNGSVLRCVVTGTVDAVVKAAAQFEVTDIVSREPSLEEVFLAFYNGVESEEEHHAAA